MAPTYAPSDASVSDDLRDYDIISDAGPPSLESSLADFGSAMPSSTPREIPPSAEARARFETAAMGAEDVQAAVQRTVRTKSGAGNGNGTGTGTVRRSMSRDPAERERTVRVYVDGVFDVLHVGIAHQLRQAKLSFPSVHLIVGPFTDGACLADGISTSVPHVERCELVRHCRWVDEVLYDAPVVLDAAFLSRNRIDYVAVEEGSSINPDVSKARMEGYDFIKSFGKAIPTKRTKNVVAYRLKLQEPALLDPTQVVITPNPPTLALQDLSLSAIPAGQNCPLPDTPPEPREEFGA